MAADPFHISNYSYSYDPKLIAQIPVLERDRSRLMVCDRLQETVAHCCFSDIATYFRRGDILVLNESHVELARLVAVRESGQKIDCLLVKQLSENSFQILAKNAKRLRCGERLVFYSTITARVEEKGDAGAVVIRMEGESSRLREIQERFGLPPLPPYIRRHEGDPRFEMDRVRYQTVYANPERPGSIAAPTAGLHFTPELLEKISAQGVEVLKLALHVGTGTFRPIRAEDIREHRMHSEAAFVPRAILERVLEVKRAVSARVFAVGTTTVRALESAYANHMAGTFSEHFETALYIYPGYVFQAVDALVTNFHQPQTTLLAMIAAFVGDPAGVQRYYEEAQKAGYRFFSYGDAMLIL